MAGPAGPSIFKVDANGKTTTVYAFVLLLGYSRAMYVEFVERCTLEIFMDCHIRAFEQVEGVQAGSSTTKLSTA